MGTAGLRGTGAQRVRAQRPGAWRRVELHCSALLDDPWGDGPPDERCDTRWVATVLADHTTVRCRRCGERVEIPDP